MAPEQLRGEAADARTDIYAAGVVLYEMVTGQRPFREQLAPRLTDAILHTPAPLPSRLKPGLSPRLEEVILKCLEKEPENRYQSARELSVDLRRLSMATSSATHAREPAPARRPRRGAPKRIHSLAVLPLENLSRDPEQEYFADGMTEALITDLAKISALKVISRTSAMRFKGTDKPLPTIARELNVDAVVEGSVLRAASRVRITAQLIHAATDEHLWAESYQRELRDILDLQSEVAQAIAKEIQIKLTPREQAQFARARPVNPAAHDAFLKGNFYWNKWTQEGFRKGVEYFERAVGEDPTHAPAYAGLALCHLFLGYWGFVDPRAAYPKAKAAALKALELDDSLADAHCALGAVRWFHDWDLPGAESEMKRALELNRNDATAHTWYAVILSVIKNDFEKALAEARRAQELDPLSSFINVCFGWICYWACQYDRAIEICRKLLEMDPNTDQAYRVMGCCALNMRRLEEAIAAFEKAVSLSGDVGAIAFLGTAYGLSGQVEKARALLRELEVRAEREYVSPMAFIWLHLGLGEREKMFEWVDRAFEQRDAMLFWLRFFPGMLDDPRVLELLRRMNVLP
jgi:TolB-like protein/Flp pilus assembly protein TadD